MRHRTLYDARARKQTVSLSVNADLIAKVKEAGINASPVAEEALAVTLTERREVFLREEMARDVTWIEAYEAAHGSFPELMRAFEEGADGDGARLVPSTINSDGRPDASTPLARLPTSSMQPLPNAPT